LFKVKPITYPHAMEVWSYYNTFIFFKLLLVAFQKTMCLK